jgi:hypothetical protein
MRQTSKASVVRQKFDDMGSGSLCPDGSLGEADLGRWWNMAMCGWRGGPPAESREWRRHLLTDAPLEQGPNSVVRVYLETRSLAVALMLPVRPGHESSSADRRVGFRR